ncbi:MAG: GGDEF domain-containing protein, partial [Campylobacteraceae bacterium]|nr:GGDEF domain-containing protein [Campylobacteraceae bacterium]
KSVLSEHFNEVNDKWYQLQEQVIDVNETLTIKNAFAIDISLQKEAQGELIKSNVKLSLQSNELKEAHDELKELSNRDPMTNLYNRRYLSEVSNELFLLSKRNNSALSVLMIDIDKFKYINDSYGHDIGDEVIKLLANTLTQSLRETDIVARLGGEEFVIILPETNLKGAEKKAEEIRQTVEELSYNISTSKKREFTVSIGVSEYNKTDISFDTLLKKADKALYEAKEKGRNRVELN